MWRGSMKGNKKNLKKRMQLIGIAGICMIGVTGCMMSKREMDRQAVEKFKEKYGVDCEVIYTDIIDDSIENRDEIHVYVEEYMEEGETAIIYSWQEDGKVHFEDNLFGFIIREDYEKDVETIAEKQFEEVRVFVRYVSASFDNELTQNSVLEDAYKIGEKMITRIDIVVESKDDKEQFKEKGDIICNLIKENNLKGGIHIYKVTKEAFQRMNRINYNDIVSVIGDKPVGENTLDFYSGKTYK